MSGKIFAIFVSLLFLILFTKNSIAGSKKSPEVVDVEGDAPDRLTGENVSHLDILAVWFNNDTATHIKITLKLSSLYVIVNPKGTTLSIHRIGWQYSDSKDPDLWWYAQVETTDNIYVSGFTYFVEDQGIRRDTERGCFCGRNKSTPGTFRFYIDKYDVGNPAPNTTLKNIYCESYEARQTYNGKDWLYHRVDNTSFGKNFTLTGGSETSEDALKPDFSLNNTDDRHMSDSDSGFIPSFYGLEIIVIIIFLTFIRKKFNLIS